MSDTDLELLARYTRDRAEDAFSEVVRRHLDLVHSAALRQVRSPQLAEEVAQSTFIKLANHAHRLAPDTILTAWLYQVTRREAIDVVRREARRQLREQIAVEMNAMNANADDWRQIEPLLDDAMHALDDTDRTAVLLRYFENKSLREVGDSLGTTDDTARKRVNRAIEHLREFFAKRGVTVGASGLVVIISANTVQAAPVGLFLTISTAVAFAKGATASASTLTLIKGALKIIAWTKTRTAMVIGASALLAAGTAAAVVNSVNASPDDIINKLERQTGKKIVWDKRINFPATFAVKDQSLEEALDQLAVEAGAYWSVDYAIYDSDRAFRQLLAALHDGTDLQSAGWTNLSSRPLKPQMQIIGYRQGGGMRMGTNAANDLVGMVVMLDREASAKRNQNFRQWSMQNREALQSGKAAAHPPDTEIRIPIQQAMNDGVADGVLAPERLLADMQFVPKIHSASPVPATPEAAEQMAKAVHARWTTVYTLRKSPVEGAGIKLIHYGMLTVYGSSTNSLLSPSPETLLKKAQQTSTTLTSEERVAHERAVKATKQK